MVNEHRVTWTTGLLDSLFGLFYGPFFGPYFGPFFGLFSDHFIGGGGEADHYYLGRGGMHSIRTQGGVVGILLLQTEGW